ncbi:hypothetical protein NL676_039323, partial [Syzygium grande]
SGEARSQDRAQSRSTALFNREVAFPRLETLKIDGLDNLGFMFFPSMVNSFAQLKNLSVQSCEKMEAIITEGEGLGMETSETLVFPMLTNLCLDQLKSLTCFSRGKCSREGQSQDYIISRFTALFNREVAFPNLETLDIKSMDNIEMIWDNQVAADSFRNLKSLCVHECNKLKCVWDKELHRQVKFQCLRSIHVCRCKSLSSLFPVSVITGDLKQLEELKIDECDIAELIEKEEGLVPKFVFPSLTSLELKHLTKLKCLFTGTHTSHWPALKTLKVDSCDKVEIFASQIENEMPCHKQPLFLIEKDAIEGTSDELKVILPFSGYIRHMQTLDVSHCDALSNIFTPTIAKNLVALTKLRISNCRILTKVLGDEEGEEGHVVAFNQLKYMELDGLIELRCFSSGGYILMFPLLEDVIVNGCPNMKFFSEGPIEAPKLERVQVSLKELYGPTNYQHFWKGNLNITIQNMFEEMATIVGAKFVRLFEFPKLIGNWHNDLHPIKSSWQLGTLVVDKCPSFINAIPSKLMLILEKMTSLHVRDCESMEEIFDLEGLEAMESTQVLPRLENLDLVNLPKLRQLWNKYLQGKMCFDSLSNLTLYKCSNLRLAFTPSMAQCLANLERMKIKECGQMEGVIVEEERQGSTVEKITFPKLRVMELECLPNLTTLLSGKDHTLECPQLNRLTIAHCPKMRSLTWQSSMDIDHGTPSLFTPQVQFPQLWRIDLSHMDNLSKIWTDDPQETLTFENLWGVEAQNCKSLENLFPHWVATSLTQLFPKLTSLVLHDMPRLKSFYPNLPNLNWPFLKELRVTHCDKLDILSVVTSMNKWIQRDDQQDLLNQEAHSSIERDFPNLEKLLLVDKDVQRIQDGKFPDDIFGKPKALTLACFHDGKAVFPPRFLLERFQNLQSLEVFCSSFEDIFPDEGLVDEGKHPMLENLRELKLSKLHNLKRVWREDYLMAKILRGIKKFETSFQNLTELVVKNSSGLIHLVTASAITNLVHLTWMTIIGCEKMKEVVANDENGEGKVISLGKLSSLTLQNLPSLECFSSATSCIFMFPSLFWIEVEECPQMKIFSKGMLRTPKLHLVTLFGYKWEWNWEERDLNTTIQKRKCDAGDGTAEPGQSSPLHQRRSCSLSPASVSGKFVSSRFFTHHFFRFSPLIAREFLPIFVNLPRFPTRPRPLTALKSANKFQTDHPLFKLGMPKRFARKYGENLSKGFMRKYGENSRKDAYERMVQLFGLWNWKNMSLGRDRSSNCSSLDFPGKLKEPSLCNALEPASKYKPRVSFLQNCGEVNTYEEKQCESSRFIPKDAH